jgi:hypothetical protein
MDRGRMTMAFAIRSDRGSSVMRWKRMIEYLEKNFKSFEGKKVLLVARYIYLNKLLIGLLKYLLEIKHAKGIYIAVDRPYKYTSKLLEKHNVPQENLFYLDAVTMISNEPVHRADNVRLIESPFCTDLHTEVLSMMDDIDSHRQGSSFVFLDNITVMLNYIDEDCLYGFLGKLVIQLSEEGKALTITIVDKDAHPNIYNNARERTDIEIAIPEEILQGW